MPENTKQTTAPQVRAARCEMRKTVETKEDGRLLIYYTFAPKAVSGQQEALDIKTTKPKEQEVCQ